MKTAFAFALAALAALAAGCGGESSTLNSDVDAFDAKGETDGDADDDGADSEKTSLDPNADGTLSYDKTSYKLPYKNADESLDIDLTIYAPAEKRAYPLIIFTHGFLLSPEGYFSYAQRLASYGFVVVMPQMPGTLTAPKTHKQQAAYLKAILDWALGEGSAAGGALDGKINAEKIGVNGHSMGGKLSMLLASSDLRPKAAFLVDPVDSGPPSGGDAADYPSVAPELMPLIKIPFVALGETINSANGSCAPGNNNYEQYYAAAQSPSLKITMVGANHMSFLDDPDCGLACAICKKGTDDPAVTRALTLKYMTAFYLMKFYDRPELSEYLTGGKMQEDVSATLAQIEFKNGF